MHLMTLISIQKDILGNVSNIAVTNDVMNSFLVHNCTWKKPKNNTFSYKNNFIKTRRLFSLNKAKNL